MFVGRGEELAQLERMYSGDKFEFAVIYGRRRVGKTTLIREFCRGKRAFYFVARETDDSANLKMFSKELFAQGFIPSDATFESWDAAFSTLAKLSSSGRFVAVIDEYPYLASACRGMSSIIQTYVDRDFNKGRMFLILCGSSMSFMENQLLGHKSPLYGRRTAQLKIKPFGFSDSRKFLGGFTPDDQAAIYGATGGVPEYLSRVDGTLSLRENIIRMFLNESGALYEEPSNLLKQELREPAVYNTIIASIAGGASRLSDIAAKAQTESNKASKYLSSLISLGIVTSSPILICLGTLNNFRIS